MALGPALIGGLFQASAAKRAANQQAAAAASELELQKQMYGETTANFAPYRESGLQGWQAYLSELGLGEAPKGFTGFQKTPGYDFAMGQGMDALQSSAAARGGLYSGAAMADAQRLGQGMANQEYGNYLNRLAGIGQAGQAAAGNQANAAQNYAAGAGNALASIGNAQSAGSIGVGNAISGGINNALGAWMYQKANPQAQQGLTVGGGLFGGNSWGR